MHKVLTNILIVLLALLAGEVSAQRVMPTVKMYGNFGSDYTKGTIIVCDPDSLQPDTFAMYAKYRGGTSMSYEKKNFAVKLVDTNDYKLSASLLGMRNDNSWILDAMAIDKARMRNRVAFDIWNAMDVKPYYYENEPNVRTGIDGKFVELYINDDYNGLYCLNEKIDRKQLKLKKMKDGEVYGVLYKGFDWNGTGFGDEPDAYSNNSSVYQGFESVYPDVTDNGVTEWLPLIEKERFMYYSTSYDFADNYDLHFDVPMLMNMHILINSTGALDNKGKNQFFYIYDITEDRKMSFAPWDLDCSFGRTYDGSKNKFAYDSLLYENHIIRKLNRIDSTFLYSTSDRYYELRNTVLATDSIKARFDAYFQLFEETGAAQREIEKWNGVNGINLDFAEEKEFIHYFIEYRMAVLDNYYKKGSGVVNIPSTLSDGIIYDIYGRRVYDPQPSRMYIQNGRVIFMKK